MKKAPDFKNGTIKQIRLWAWTAAVLPISALVAVVFVWKFMDESFLGYFIITGETVMFTLAVMWWWWVLYVTRNLIKQWDNTKNKVEDVQKTIIELRTLVNDVVSQRRTK
jgi:high-affinity Fe2+/Pb2+ permease